MSLDKESKSSITKEFRIHPKDTGSSDVQIALLTARINEITITGGIGLINVTKCGHLDIFIRHKEIQQLRPPVPDADESHADLVIGPQDACFPGHPKRLKTGDSRSSNG